MAMNCLRLLFLLFIVGQSLSFAQKDSTKKNFKPYGLIDAAPVAISKDDFKPQVILTIQAVDAITKHPLNAKFDFYFHSDSVINTENGKVVSLEIVGNEKIIIVLNARGYIWQTQVFNAPVSDTTYVVKLVKINKGDVITKQIIDFRSMSTEFESELNPDLLGLKEFLKLNPTVKIQIAVCPKGKDEIYAYLIKSVYKRHFRLVNCRNQKQTNAGTMTIKILHT